VKKRNFKLALVQMKVRPGKKLENLRRALLFIKEAAAMGA
jgi:predicted amidohydrolase